MTAAGGATSSNVIVHLCPLIARALLPLTHSLAQPLASNCALSFCASVMHGKKCTCIGWRCVGGGLARAAWARARGAFGDGQVGVCSQTVWVVGVPSFTQEEGCPAVSIRVHLPLDRANPNPKPKPNP